MEITDAAYVGLLAGVPVPLSVERKQVHKDALALSLGIF